MADLPSLITKRKTLKSNLTRCKTFITKAELSIQDNVIPQRVQIEAALRKTKMETWLNEFESIQSQIENLDNTITEQDASDARNSFEDTFYDVLTTLTDLSQQYISSSTQRELVPGIPSGENLQDVDHASNMSEIASPETHNPSLHKPLDKPQIRLPRISLPVFSDQVEQWLNLKDMFTSLIHDRDNITSIEKFQYLKASVSGDAASIIQAILLSATNYEVAWESIKTRYENKPQIINNHIKSIFEIESITKESHSQLQELLNNLLSNINSLRALGQPTDQWDSIIIYLIRSKLDPVTKREWEKMRSDMKELPTFTDLTSFPTKNVNC